MKILLATFLLFSSGSLAANSLCEKLTLGPVEFPKTTRAFQGFLSLPSGRELFVEYLKPRLGSPKGSVVLVHGLMDSHQRYQDLTAKLLDDGYSVLRMDLFGFGKTLVHNLGLHQGSIGFLRSLPFSANVQDLKEVLMWASVEFEIPQFELVGHSMGGGLIVALATDPEIQPILRRLILVAPYIYRLEQYELEKALGRPSEYWASLVPDFWKNSYSRMWDHFWEANTERLVDTYLSLSDPVADNLYLDYVLKHGFSAHMEELKAEPVSGSLRSALLTSAVATVKGLRDLNAFELIDHIPENIQIDQIITREDGLVPPEFQRRFGKKLSNRRTTRVWGVDADHLFPSEQPSVLFRLISERALRP